MRILFLGTPEYAVPSLKRLAAEHQVVGVVAQPDQPVGRRGASVPPPVAEFARAGGLALFQPERPGRKEFIAGLAGLGAELAVVVAYGHILRPALIALAPRGMLNAHGSLLPRYRGAAPIQRAILAGEIETGVTVQQVVFAVDAGPVVLQEKLGIGPEETAGELSARMAELSAECLSRAVRLIESGPAAFTPQDESAATFAPKLTKEEGRADWSQPADYLARAARAYNPWPTLYTKLPGGRSLKMLRARAEKGSGAFSEAEPGTVLLAAGEDFVVATGAGALRLLEIQAEGRRPMAAADFLRGARLMGGARLG